MAGNLFTGRQAHFFDIAMVTGNNHGIAFTPCCINDAAKLFIYRFNCLNAGLEVAGMTHHVTIGIIHYDDIVFPASNSIHQLVGDLRSAHFRLQVIGRHIR